MPSGVKRKCPLLPPKPIYSRAAAVLARPAFSRLHPEPPSQNNGILRPPAAFAARMAKDPRLFMEYPGVPERSPEAKTERGMDFSVLRIQDPQPHILSLKYSHSSERWEFYV